MKAVIDAAITTTGVTSRASRLIEGMQGIIKHHGLELMQRYPDDLLVHDRRILESLENSSCSIGWCVGHGHTHMVILGVHPEENSMVDCFLNLASDDKFYKIILQGKEDFKLQEVSRANFEALKSIRVPFTKKGTHLEFTLFKDANPMVNVHIRQDGTFETRKFFVSFQPLVDVTEFDQKSAELWAYKSIASYTGTLFYALGESTWHSLRSEAIYKN